MVETGTLQERTELDGLPLYLPDDNAVLIGRVSDEESELAGQAAYYIHWRDGVHIGRYNVEDQAFTPELALEAESRLMAHQAKQLAQSGIGVELSSIGEALVDAYNYATKGGLPDKQAHVYALRKHGFERQEIAEILNISASTVDTQRTSAQQKVEAAYSLVNLDSSTDIDHVEPNPPA